MANTRETMGEQACLDALVANTLTSFEDDGVTKVGENCLRYHTALIDVTLPQCKSVELYGLAECTNLEVVDMLGRGVINSNAFNGDTKLAHLLLRGTAKTTLASTNAFSGTPISLGNGAIYVPSDLLATYKADTNWKKYFITTLDKYPITDFSSITESWTELDAMTQEQIAAKYAIGDTKLVDLGTEGKVYMQIAGFGLDDLTSGGKAKVTFIARETLLSNHRMNPAYSSSTQGTGTVGGWEHCEMRTYLSDTIFPLLPSELQTAIKSVTKYSDYYAPSDTANLVHDQETQDKLWIPSSRETYIKTHYEQTGPMYSDFFINGTARVRKTQSGSTAFWWLRSAYSASNFSFVNTGSGSYLDNSGSSSTYGIVLGFCI